MPPRGYANLTVRTETRERLERLMHEKGLANLNDAVAYLLEVHQQYEKLEERLQAVEKRLEELETLQRKTYLTVLRLIEELAARSKEGPESLAGAVENEHPARTEPRPHGAVASTSSTDPAPARPGPPRETHKHPPT